jgi:hypothetical protein
MHEALLTASVSPAVLAWNAGAFVVEAREGGWRGPIDVAHDGLRIAADGRFESPAS